MIFCLILELIYLLISYVSTLSPLSLTKPVPDGFGVQIHFTHPKAGEMEMIRAAGFKWVRMDFFWESMEKKKGEYYFNDYDVLVIDRKRKFRTL
jgi:hypothetical protein